VTESITKRKFQKDKEVVKKKNLSFSLTSNKQHAETYFEELGRD
jgi:hypothetical protein